MRSSLKRWGFAISLALGPSALLASACGPKVLDMGVIRGNDSGESDDSSIPSDGWFPDGWIDAPKPTCELVDAAPDAGWLQPVAVCRCLEGTCCNELNACTTSAGGSCDPFASCYFRCMRVIPDAGGDVLDGSAFDPDATDGAMSAFDDDAGDASAEDASGDGSVPGRAALCESWCSGEEGAAVYGALLRCARSECSCAF